MKAIIQNLKRQIKFNKKYGENPDAASWGNIQGVLISTAEAEKIVSALTPHVQSELFEKIEQLKKEFTDKKIRELNPIWVRDEILKRLE